MFRLVLVMVSLVVQMVGVLALPLLFGGGGGWEGGPVSSWFVRVLWLSVDGAAFSPVLEGGAGVGRECCRPCSGC